MCSSNSETNIWVAFWLASAVCLSSIAWAITYYSVTIDKAAIEAGMEQAVVGNSKGWVKSKE